MAIRTPAREEAVFVGLIVVLIALSVAVAVLPEIHGHVFAPALDLVFDTIAAAASIGVAALAWARFRQDREPIALFQAAAFLPLAIAYAVAIGVTVAGEAAGRSPSLVADEQNYVFAVARLSTAALLVAGGTSAAGTWGARRPATLVAVAILPLAATLAFVDTTAAAALPPIVTTAGDPTALPDIAPFGLAVQVTVAVMFLVAAWVVRRPRARRRVVSDAYLAIGLLFATFAEVQWAIYPSDHPAQVSFGDVLRLACFVTLLLGIEAEAREILGQLRRANNELESLREADLARAQLEERARLARDLHDGLAQDLWLAKLKAGRLAAVGELSGESGRLLGEVENAISAGLAEARQALMTLRSAAPAGTGLCDLLRRDVEDFEDRFGVRVSLTCDRGADALPTRSQAELLRIVQEALVNTRKHADATVVRVTLSVEGGSVDLSVTDNGRGFDPSGVREQAFGLISMQERAKLIGGSFAIETRPGDGTRITVRAPLSGPPAGLSGSDAVATAQEPA